MRLHSTGLACLVGWALASVEGGMGVLLAPYLQLHGYPAATIGLFVSLYAVAAIVSRLPAGRWYRAGWVRRLLVVALLGQAAANLLYPHYQDALPLVLVRLATGFAYGLGTTVNLAQFLDGLPPGESRDRPTAIYTAAVSLGFATGNVTGGLFAEWFGYSLAFLGTSTYAVLAATLTLFAVEPAVLRTGGKRRHSPAAFLAALGEPRLLLVLIEVFLFNFLFGLQYALFPLYLLAVGAVLSQLGIIRGLFSGSQIASRVAAGWLTSRFGYQRVAAWALVAQIAALALTPATTNLWLLATFGIAYGVARGATMMANTLGLAVASERSTLGRGASSGVYNAASDAGTLVGPILAGATADALDIGSAFVVLPLGVLAVYAASVWFTERRLHALPRPAL